MSETSTNYVIEDIQCSKGCTISNEVKKEVVKLLNEEKLELKEFVGIAYYEYYDIEPNRIIEIHGIEYSDFIFVKKVKVVQSHMNEIIVEPILVVQVEGYDVSCCV